MKSKTKKKREREKKKGKGFLVFVCIQLKSINKRNLLFLDCHPEGGVGKKSFCSTQKEKEKREKKKRKKKNRYFRYG